MKPKTIEWIISIISIVIIILLFRELNKSIKDEDSLIEEGFERVRNAWNR